MLYWKWSKGETYYKSPRPNKNEINNQNDSKINDTNQPQYNFETSQNAIEQTLDDSKFSSFDTNFMYMTNPQNETDLSNDFSATREDLDGKISDREPVYQRGINPFLTQSSYVNDIVTRDIFMKPINTSSSERNSNNVNNQSEQFEPNHFS